MALAVFQHFQSSLLATLAGCGSGKELIDRGREADVKLAADLDCSQVVPWLQDRMYLAFST
jgi:phosphosulfolactate phosphohydrolase-like enzyme